MRTVRIPECSYERFYEIRKEILRTTPYGLYNTEYLKEDKLAFFCFWDSDYIPKEYVIRPVSRNPEEYINLAQKEAIETGKPRTILTANIPPKELNAIAQKHKEIEENNSIIIYCSDCHKPIMEEVFHPEVYLSVCNKCNEKHKKIISPDDEEPTLD